MFIIIAIISFGNLGCSKINFPGEFYPPQDSYCVHSDLEVAIFSLQDRSREFSFSCGTVSPFKVMGGLQWTGASALACQL